MANASLYCRFSPRPDAATSESNALQRAMCVEYCREHGHSIEHEESDADMSGDDETRPGLWAAIAALKRGWVLVAHDGDRIARDVYLAEYVRREVRKHGATIETVTTGREGTSIQDVLVRQILQAVAEANKKITAAKTKAMMLARQSSGMAMSKQPPYGKAIGPTVTVMRHGKPEQRATLVDCPEEAEAIAAILSEHRRGLGPREIARTMNDGGWPCRGKHWRHTTIMRIVARNG